MCMSKRKISLSALKEIGELRLYVAFPKFLPWERKNQPTLLWISILGLKAGKPCSKRGHLCWIHCQPHPPWDSVPPVFSSSRLTQACIMAVCQNVAAKINCTGIYQTSACITFSHIILAKANHIAYPRVRVDPAKLHDRGPGYGVGKELGLFLKSIRCTPYHVQTM